MYSVRSGCLALAVALAAAGCAAPPAKPSRPPSAKPAPAAPAKPARAAKPGTKATAPRTQASKTPPPAAQPQRKLTPEERYAGALELMESNQWGDAEQAFLLLTQSNPNYSGPWTNLGILYAQTERKDQAREALERAVRANPRNEVALTWLGVLYREAGDYARAESAYRRAIAARGDYAPAHLNLGILYDAHLNRSKDALRHYRRYRELAGKDDLRTAAWIAELEARSAGGTAPVETMRP